ncbi:hypothetical protein UPYG_G00317750 [Umbra pygmaea]|uniref:Dipeptidylpeptidase IV N-terminal domain-containing protein n=1 Tax=Umbra pygmaea TaxID=75934 RepID=A0ABD0WK50_UMBPY
MVFNGIADWLYEEEVLHSQVCHWWSPDGSRLAYLTLNDTLVPNMLLPRFTGSLYPRGQQYPYPKNEQPVFSKDGNTFFFTMPIKHGGRGSFHHIAMISEQFNGNEVNMRHLTSGSWEVSQILEYDEKADIVYFLSTEDGSTQRQLYRVLAVDPFQRECLTCSLFKPQCSYYHAVFSPDYQHVLLNCKGPGIPRTTLHKLSDMSKNATLEKNTVLRDALMYRKIPRRDIRTLQINSLALRLELTLPVDFDEATAHPLLLIIDSAPGGQAVSDQFILDWDLVLVSTDHVIVARLDGRGSGFLGQRVLHEVHQRLGTVDMQDQIAADPDQVAICRYEQSCSIWKGLRGLPKFTTPSLLWLLVQVWGCCSSCDRLETLRFSIH